MSTTAQTCALGIITNHASRDTRYEPRFMQNKPNFRKSQMNVSTFSQKAYENKYDWTLGENKPKQTQFPKGQNEIKLLFNKGL